jgi:IPT/TIG domain
LMSVLSRWLKRPAKITGRSKKKRAELRPAASRQAVSRAFLGVEQLEERVLPSGVSPTVSSVTPSEMSINGGTIAIFGTNFNGCEYVDVGYVVNGPGFFTLVSNTEVTVNIAPPVTPGTVDVVVVTSAGTSATSPADQVTFAAPPSAPTSISPTSGPQSGGTTVTLNGTNMAGITSVYFNGTEVTPISTTATQVVAVSPPGTGTVFLSVGNALGVSGSSGADMFTYTAGVAAPTVSGISPASGPAAGNTSVTITGSNLSNATSVMFGSAAGSIVSDTATQIVATSPAGTGVANVTVTTAGGTSAASAADQFTYSTPPAVTSVVVNQDYIPVNGASISGGVATLETDGNSGFTAGNQIIVAGFTGAQTGFNGTYTIATVTGDQITYADSNTANVSTTTFNTAGYAISANTTSGLQYAATGYTAQRSMVDSIAYTFNTAVNLAAGAVTLGIGTGAASGEAPATATPNVILTSLNGGTIWVVTFASNANAAVTGRSIADGIYTATLNSSLATAVSGGATMATTRPTDTFYRLFGDYLGDGRVNSTGSGELNTSFGLNYLSSAGYMDFFDYNGAGRINSMDSAALNLNFGSYWYGFAATI